MPSPIHSPIPPAGTPSPSSADSSTPVERYRLPSGLTVILKPQYTAPVVAIQCWVGVGSADESEKIAGVSHVFEHMLFKGTARRGVGRIAREVEAAGGEINAWTSFDQTVYHVVLGSRFFDAGIDILTDAIRNSSFDRVELERELKVVLEEVKQGEDNPGRLVTQELFRAAYARHTYRRPVIGYVRTVEKFRRADLLAVFRRYYVPNNITVVVVGDFDPVKARKKIAQAWKGARRRALPSMVRPVEPKQRAMRLALRGGEVSEVHVVGGFHIPALRHADTAALDVAALVLGQGDSSRLQVDLKRTRQLVSEAWAYSFTPRDPGLLVVGATLPPERLGDAPEALFSEAFRLAHEEARHDEVEKARAIIESDAVYQKETVQGMARKLGFFETVAGSLGGEEEYLASVRQVTPTSLREVVARYLVPENLTLSVMLPAAAKELGSASAKRTFEKELRAAVVRAAASAKKSGAAKQPPKGKPAKKAHPGAAREVHRQDVVCEELPSGARVLVMRDPTVPLVAMRAAWLGGLRKESERDNGINNLLSALVTRGTASRTGDQIAHEMEALAGSISGFAGRNSFGLRAEVLSRHFEHGLEMLADCALQPAFADAEIAREKRQILEEIRTQEDNVSSVAFRLFGRALWPEHPYRLDMLGTPESVAALDRAQLARYHAANHRPAGMTLAVVGDVEPRQVIDQVARLFPAEVGGAPTGRRGKVMLGEVPKGSTHPAALRVTRHLKKQQAHLVVGFPGVTLGHPDRFALELLSTILSGQGGRLFAELREKRGLAYRVSAFTLEGLDPGYFAVYVSCSPEKLAVAEERILVELERIRERRVPASELSRAQRYLAGSHDISLQRRSALAATLAFNECYGLGWEQHLRYAPSIMEVTAEELQRVARHYLAPARSVTAVVSPDEAVGASVVPETPGRKDPVARAARAASKTRPRA